MILSECENRRARIPHRRGGRGDGQARRGDSRTSLPRRSVDTGAEGNEGRLRARARLGAARNPGKPPDVGTGIVWGGYLSRTSRRGGLGEAAAAGARDPRSDLAWTVGTLHAEHPIEIDMIVGKDREGFFTNGLTLGAKKCSVIRDSLYVDGDCTMDIRTKSQGGEPTYNVAVGRAGRALVIVMGKEGVHGGTLNKKAYELALYLRRSDV
nr:profilin-2 [Loxodonta africana]